MSQSIEIEQNDNAAEGRRYNSTVLESFSKAMEFFNSQKYSNAKEIFESILLERSLDTEIGSRARTYIAICQKKLKTSIVEPQAPEELYAQGIYELNRDSLEKAVKYLEAALAFNPNGAHILYALAAAKARSGSKEEAIEYLRRSIENDQSSRNRVGARRDPDFSSLFDNPEFQRMISSSHIQDYSVDEEDLDDEESESEEE
ncbi:MAG: tetratricopeptide repeat protein [Blastocatellia bacterium]|nr:tetratricopeptide repeat protein [Blastocatellia bacterium]